MGILVFIGAAGIFLLLSTTVFFNVETIIVTGSSNYTADEIIKASGLKAGDNLVRTDTEECSEKIEQTLVYIEKADITRQFPNTMEITVEASVPAANFMSENGILLISEGGKVLDNIDDPKAGLLNFTGTDPYPGLLPGQMFRSTDEHKTTAIEKLMEYFSRADHDYVTLVDVSDRSDIRYTYEGRILVKLGSINDIDYKMNFSREIIRDKIGERTEGELTIMSDANIASFLDKASIEHNAKVYNDNIAAKEAEENGENLPETEHTEKNDSGIIME